MLVVAPENWYFDRINFKRSNKYTSEKTIRKYGATNFIHLLLFHCCYIKTTLCNMCDTHVMRISHVKRVYIVKYKCIQYKV